MSVMVRYRTGVVLNYSLNAYLPQEGFNVAFNGTGGRLEYREAHASHVTDGSDPPADEVGWKTELVVHPMFKRAYRVDIPAAEGGHGGGDPLLQEQVFSSSPPSDPWRRGAGHGQGAASVLIGAAANTSFETGSPVSIDDICPELGDAQHLRELV